MLLVVAARVMRRRHRETDVALPFFGRKPASPAPGAQRDARARAEAQAVQDDRPPPTELSALDFTGTDHGRALARVAGQVEVRECGSGIGSEIGVRIPEGEQLGDTRGVRRARRR